MRYMMAILLVHCLQDVGSYSWLSSNMGWRGRRLSVNSSISPIQIGESLPDLFE